MRILRAFFGDQRESLWRLGMSPALIGFDEVDASGEEPLEKIKGSGPGRGDNEVK